MNSSYHRQITTKNSYSSDLKKVYLEKNKPKFKNGDIWSQKIRNVCLSCNNGWMSRLENNIKENLLDLIIDKKIKLGANEQTRLSAWIALVTIMAEYTQRETQSVSQEERTLFNEQLNHSKKLEYI